MLHGFEGKSCLLSVGMLTRRMWFWKSPVSMFCRGAFRLVVKLLDSNARTILKAKTIRHQ